MEGRLIKSFNKEEKVNLQEKHREDWEKGLEMYLTVEQLKDLHNRVA